MNFTITSYILFAISNLTLFMGMFVWWKNKKNLINIYFLLMTLISFIWIDSVNLFIIEAESNARLFIWAKIIWASAPLFLLLNVLFSFIYPIKMNKNWQIKILPFVLMYIAIIIMLVFNILIDKVNFYSNGTDRGNIGPGGPFMAFYLLISYIIMIINFLIKLKKTEGMTKKRVQYIFIGVLLYILTAIIFGFILPEWIMRNPELSKYYSLKYTDTLSIITMAPIFWIIFTGIAIVRYKALEISTVIHKTFVWIVVSSLIILPIGLGLYFFHDIFNNFNIVQKTLLIFVLIYGYSFYFKYIQPQIDHLFQRRKFDYSKELQKIGQKAATTLDTKSLTDNIITTLYRILYTDKIFIILKTKEQNKIYDFELYNNKNMKNFEHKKYTSVIKYITDTKELLEKEQIEVDPQYKNLKKDYSIYANETGIEISIPIILENRVIGIIGIGKKENLKSYKRQDVQFLNDLSKQVSINVFNALHYEDILEKQRLQQEMAMAERIQTAIVPDAPLHDELEISVVMKPAEEVGGDYYDILSDKQKNLWFAIGDVSGHGVTPGLIMMMAQSVFSGNIGANDITPKKAMLNVNEILFENIKNRLKETHFMTMTFLKYINNGEFICSGAGHPDIIIYRDKTKTCELIKTEGVFLGVKPNISKMISESKFKLHKNDLMLLYTDGIIEAHNKDDRKNLFGMDRLQDIIKKHADKNVNKIKTSILNTTLDWCGHKPDDDITMLLVKKK